MAATRDGIGSIRQGGARSSRAWTWPWTFSERTNSRGFSVVTFQDATKLGLASNSAFRLRNEVFVQNGIVSPDTAMRALLVIMFQPHTEDVVELSSTEANEVIQDLSLCSSDEAFAECIRHWSTRWDFYWSHISLLPKHVERMRILSITISDQEPKIDAFVFGPHRCVPDLLHDPSGIRMIGARTAKDFSSTQMNEHKNIGITYAAEGIMRSVEALKAIVDDISKF